MNAWKALARASVTSCLAVVLAACGGGGGSSGSSVSQGAPSIDAARSTVVEGGAPVVMTSSSGSVFWTLSPAVGSLSAPSGSSVTYVPPPAGALAADSTVVVTAIPSTGTSSTLTLTVVRSAVRLAAGAPTTTATVGDATTLAFTLVPNVPVTGVVSMNVADASGRLVTTAATLSSNPDGSYAIAVPTLADIPSGIYPGTVTVTLCTDAACATPILGRPLSVDYSLQVDANTGLVALASWPGVPDWSTFQANAGHTGYVPVTLKPITFGTRWAWTAPAAMGVVPRIGVPVSSGGRLFLDAGNLIVALKEADSLPVWTYDVSTISFGQGDGAQAPAVANGTVYFSGGHQDTTYLFAADAATGTIAFKSPMTSQWESYLAPVVAGNQVFTEGGTNGGLYAFDKASGMQQFFAFTEQTDLWSPAVDANTVYSYTGSSGYGYFRALDRTTGAVKATIQDDTFQFLGYSMNSAPVLGAPGSVFAMSRHTSLMRMDVAGSAIAWRVMGNYTGNPAYANGIVYATNQGPVGLEARAEATGNLLWSWTPQSAAENTFVGDVLLTDNLVFVSTNTTVYAIDLATHQPVWSYVRPGRLSLSASRILYIATADANGASDGTLVAINVK